MIGLLVVLGFIIFMFIINYKAKNNQDGDVGSITPIHKNEIQRGISLDLRNINGYGDFD